MLKHAGGVAVVTGVGYTATHSNGIQKTLKFFKCYKSKLKNISYNDRITLSC